MLQEYEVVKLKRALPDKGLAAGATGTVLYIYRDTPLAYEVEFTDHEGRTIALLTLGEDALEKTGPST